jgi:hypothetical protein
MDDEIVVVSGLPRSGTSLMMQMLARGGVEVITDNIRVADTDNPRGYVEFEKVKKLKEDATWLPEARGKAMKIVSQLLYDLPRSEKFKVIFMERNLDEMIASQDKMLERLNRPSAPREQVRQAFSTHLQKVRDWLGTQQNIEVLYLSYNELIERPDEHAKRIGAFLAGKVDPVKMCEAIVPSLYRNRQGKDQRDGDSGEA